MTELPQDLADGIAKLRRDYADRPDLLAIVDRIEADLKAEYARGHKAGFKDGFRQGVRDGSRKDRSEG